ncbi:MAG: DUF4365 and DUF1817 domain-containing protein [Pseudomonas fluorescens]|nr:DUF4365 and DUF1817 domain-containing protein [Pseudomonas fluorescens]
MSRGFPTYSKAAQKGDSGVDLVSRVFNEEFGWLFKRNHQEHDFGIDAQVDIVLEDGTVTGQLIALQIKYGKSFFEEKNQWGYIFRGELKHFNYLSNYPAPVLIAICHPNTKDIYWVVFDAATTSRAGSNWKITIPFENKLNGAKQRISALLPPPSDILDEMQDFWQLNEVLVTHEHIHFIIARDEVKSLDVTSIRRFFDRIRSTKELAYHCQGKVEISFHGYDNDPRELFEIPEMRQFTPVLVAALPELFFFAYTGERAQTLKALALCLTKVEVRSRTPNEHNKIPVEITTKPIGEFLYSHFAGLNEMTEWLSMPIEENKRISYQTTRAMGINLPED